MRCDHFFGLWKGANKPVCSFISLTFSLFFYVFVVVTACLRCIFKPLEAAFSHRFTIFHIKEGFLQGKYKFALKPMSAINFFFSFTFPLRFSKVPACIWFSSNLWCFPTLSPQKVSFFFFSPLIAMFLTAQYHLRTMFTILASGHERKVTWKNRIRHGTSYNCSNLPTYFHTCFAAQK